MLKVILTAAIVLSVGILSLVKTSNQVKTNPVIVTKSLADNSNKTILATAD